MASTKTVPQTLPGDKERAVLDALGTAKGRRVVTVTKTSPTGAKRTRISLERLVGKSQNSKPTEEQPKLDKKAVASGLAKGWLKEVGAQAEEGVETAAYEITDEGRLARKAKPAKAK